MAREDYGSPWRDVRHDQALVLQRRDAAEHARERRTVEQRAAERLKIASDRHEQVLAGLRSFRDQRVSQLQQEVDRLNAHREDVQDRSRSTINKLQEQQREQERNRDQHKVDRLDALDRVFQSRQGVLNHTAETDSAIVNASELAGENIQDIREQAAVHRDVARHQRSDALADSNAQKSRLTKDSDAVVAAARKQAAANVLHSEIVRNHAAVTVDHVRMKDQATRTAMEATALRTAEKADRRCRELAKVAHQVDKKCHSEIQARMKNSALDLEAAHDYCRQVKEALANEAADYKQLMVRIGQDAEANARDVERQVRQLEYERLECFAEGRRKIDEAMDYKAMKRAECDSEIGAVHNRLREVEMETRRRAKQILDMWLAGNRSAEFRVRELEQEGSDAIAEMQRIVNDMIKDSKAASEDLHKQGTDGVQQLEDQGRNTMNSTQPSVDIARRGHDEAKRSAMSEWADLKLEPAQIRAKADAEIDAMMAEADTEIQRLEREYNKWVRGPRAATKAAREEEAWLLESSAAAHKRIRAAIYQLRLFNLHDFAEDIASGVFDEPLPDETTLL